MHNEIKFILPIYSNYVKVIYNYKSLAWLQNLKKKL